MNIMIDAIDLKLILFIGFIYLYYVKNRAIQQHFDHYWIDPRVLEQAIYRPAIIKETQFNLKTVVKKKVIKKFYYNPSINNYNYQT